MQLCDDTGRVCYASHDVDRKVQADWEAQSMPIRGGWVRWYRDIRPLREKQAALRRVNQALTRSYELRCRASAVIWKACSRAMQRFAASSFGSWKPSSPASGRPSKNA